VKDLTQYLYDEWCKEQEKATAPELVASSIGAYVVWCQEKLKKNPPMGIITVDYGVGLRLVDGTEVAIVVQPEDSMGAMGDQSSLAGSGSNIPDTRCAQIMGKQETRLH